MKVGYDRATLDHPQLWHWVLPLELQTVGVEHAFSCFMPVNLDGPMDGCKNMFGVRCYKVCATPPPFGYH